MKKVSTQLSEPTVTIEMPLSEAQQIRDIIGAVSPYELEKKIRLGGKDIHPNFKKNCIRFYNELFDIIRETIQSNNISFK